MSAQADLARVHMDRMAEKVTNRPDYRRSMTASIREMSARYAGAGEEVEPDLIAHLSAAVVTLSMIVDYLLDEVEVLERKDAA